jgi:hypothetical protein
MEPKVSRVNQILQFIPYALIFEIVLALAIITGYAFGGWPGAFIASSLAALLIHIYVFTTFGKYLTVFTAVALLINGLITSWISEIYYPTNSFQLVLLKFLFFTPAAFYIVFFALAFVGLLLFLIPDLLSKIKSG